MKTDLAENYSVRKWLCSLKEGRGAIVYIVFWAILGGGILAGFNYASSKAEKRIILREAVAMDASYYEEANQSLRIVERDGIKIVIFSNNPNYLPSFVTGAIIFSILTGVPLLLNKNSKHDNTSPK